MCGCKQLNYVQIKELHKILVLGYEDISEGFMMRKVQ